MPATKQPAPFVVCFESHRANRGRVWAVKQGRRWRLAREVSIQVPTLTVYKGPAARQPRAYLVGTGVVRTITRGHIVITA